MSEFRQNPVTKQWVLIAPNRAKRPEEYKTYSVMHGVKEADPACVFCPGREAENKELYKIPDNKDWILRGVENKFHALEQTKVYQNQDFYISSPGIGYQEVIITRKHNEPVALQSINTIKATLQLFRERFHEYKKDENLSYVEIFHNHGRDAGASLVHPHYQVYATQLLPPHIHSEQQGCYQYYQLNKTCVYCDIIKEEQKHKDRVVFESDHFVVISAYASRSPFETWILPKRHSARFEDQTEDELHQLAYVLKTVLGQLYMKLSDPPLNFYTHSMPFMRSNVALQDPKSYHWHLTIFPRLTIWAGFEYATGIPINPIPPEVSTKFLRD